MNQNALTCSRPAYLQAAADHIVGGATGLFLAHWHRAHFPSSLRANSRKVSLLCSNVTWITVTVYRMSRNWLQWCFNKLLSLYLYPYHLNFSIQFLVHLLVSFQHMCVSVAAYCYVLVLKKFTCKIASKRSIIQEQNHLQGCKSPDSWTRKYVSI